MLTTSRADFGLLSPVIHELKTSGTFETMVFASGSLLLKKHGDGLADIHDDGVEITQTIDLGTMDTTPQGMSYACAAMIQGLGHALRDKKINLLMLLGDRFETLAAANTALLHDIPIAHLCGGDITEGALDDAARHAITKLSALHFVTNEPAAKRVMQLGEAPSRIFNVGSPGLDQINRVEHLSLHRLLELLEIHHDLPEDTRHFLITYHPETRSTGDTLVDLKTLLNALIPFVSDEYPENCFLHFTASNADVMGDQFTHEIQAFTRHYNHRSRLHTSLGSRRYLNLMRHASVVIGNSSSGLYEAPSFPTPTVNIGDRQKGRLRASSVLDCPADTTAISHAIQAALRLKPINVVNPYGNGNAARLIKEALQNIQDFQRLTRKPFIDQPD